MKKETCSDREFILGIDVGNSSTEIAVAETDPTTGAFTSYACSMAETTGLKGTRENIAGIKKAMSLIMEKNSITEQDLSVIRINEAAPVIGEFAMETITRTVITESTMIGHNPDTPGGEGIGKGLTVRAEHLDDVPLSGRSYIVVVPGSISFARAAQQINRKISEGMDISGAILQNDEGVLVSNRIYRAIPIVDDVRHIEKIPESVECALEVAGKGRSVQVLSNPYGIATVLSLTPQQTEKITPVAKALSGIRSAVVIKTPEDRIEDKTIPAGSIFVKTAGACKKISINDGAEKIMTDIENIASCGDIRDIYGEPGTVLGGVIAGVRRRTAVSAGRLESEIDIRDILAVDTVVPQKVEGGFSGEYSNENAVAIAVMVKTEKNHMKGLAEYFSNEINVPVEVVGIEANMAAVGALTTPGASTPLVVVDIGAGSTDACYYGSDGSFDSVHLAGAGNMVTAIIDSELGLGDFTVAEEIKKHTLAKVESFFSIRHEDGDVEFFDDPLPRDIYGRTVLVTDEGYIPLDTGHDMEKIRNIRKDAKQKILVQNVIRALKRISPTDSLRAFNHVIMVGGSALDFELCNMVTEKLERFGITAGRANIMGTEGPRGAVATGLLLSVKHDDKW